MYYGYKAAAIMFRGVMNTAKMKKFGRLFHRVYDIISRARAIELHKIGLTSIRVGVLAVIKESNQPVTIKAIATNLARELNTVT